MPNTYTYYSSTDCAIYIVPVSTGAAIEAREIFALQVGEQEQVLPIYGWNDKYFHTIGSGNILVTGTLIFNARYPNYIESLINGKPIVSQSSITENQRVLDGIKSKLDEVISTKYQVSYDTKINDLLIQLARYNDEFNSPSIENTVELSRDTMFNIHISGPYSTDIIESCRLSSRATEVNAGESNNIKSAQAFIGRKITQKSSI